MGVFYNSVIPRDGLVLHLVAGNSRSYPGTGTTWYDLSGNNNHGTLTNGPTFSAANGGSISFDGSNDYVSTSKDIDFGATPGVFLSAWIKPATTAIIQGFIGCSINGQGPEFRLYGNQLNFLIQAAWNKAVNAGTVQASVWSHVAIRSSNLTFRWSTFINGVNVANGTDDRGLGGTSKLEVSAVTVGDPWNGLIDDVRYYSRELTNNEVRQMFNSTRRRFGV